MKQFQIGLVIRGIDKVSGPAKGISAAISRITAKSEEASRKSEKAELARRRGAASSLEGKGSFMSGFGRIAAVGAAIGTVAVGVGVAARGIYSATTAASDLNESLTKTEQVFGKSTSAILAFSNKSASALGLSKRAALDFASSFGLILQAGGRSESESAKMSMKLAKLSADLASFYNVDVEEAADKVKSGLVGEARPLREFGILLSENAVKVKAIAMGFKLNNGELSEAAKVQARYQIILEQSRKAHGDFGRTSMYLANSTRIVKAQFADIIAQLGKVFLPVAQTAMRGASLALGRFKDIAGNLPKVFDTVSAASSAAWARISSLFSKGFSGANVGGMIGTFRSLGKTILDVFKPALPLVQSVSEWFTVKLGEITKWLTNMWVKAQPGLTAIVEAFKPIISVLDNLWHKVLQPLWDRVLGPLLGWIVQTMVPIIVNVLGGALRDILKVLGSVLNFMIDSFAATANFFDGVEDAITGFFTKTLPNLWSKIKGAFVGLKVILSKVWQDIWDGLFRWVEEKWGKFLDVFKKVGNFLGFGGGGSIQQTSISNQRVLPPMPIGGSVQVQPVSSSASINGQIHVSYDPGSRVWIRGENLTLGSSLGYSGGF